MAGNALACVHSTERDPSVPTETDARMAMLKAAIERCREGDLSALEGCQITHEELQTISALAKATGDAWTFSVAQLMLDSWGRAASDDPSRR